MPRLVAVMYTDIVGYTAITEENDALAVRLNERHRKVMTEEISKNHGVLQEIIGDGSLSYFNSASDCLRCAIAVQKCLRAHEEPVPLRIGMHIGEIRDEKDLIYGNPLNVASRIESLGTAGSVLLSGNVLDSISGRSEFKTVSLGAYSFKHVSQPIEIHAVTSEGLVVPSREQISGKLKILERKDIIVFDEWDDQELVRLLPKAKEICQQAVCSYSFISYNFNKLRTFLRNGGAFKCVFLHPDCEALQVAPERQFGAAQDLTYIRGQLQLAFQKLRMLEKGVEFKLTTHFPEPIMTFIDPETDDGVLFITLSGFQMELHGRPSFVLRKATHRKWFVFYYQSFLNLWNSPDSDTVQFGQSWEENLQRGKT